ncbi:MerR family transcriptional regulator [Chitinophagaceae bacterium LWZ2-11]
MAFQQLDLFATFLAEEEPVKEREASSQKIAVEILNQIPHKEQEEEAQPEQEVFPIEEKQVLPVNEIAIEQVKDIPEKITRRNNLDVIFDDGIIRVTLIKEKNGLVTDSPESENVAEGSIILVEEESASIIEEIVLGEDEIIPAFEYETLEEQASIVEENILEEDEIVPAFEYEALEEPVSIVEENVLEEDEIVPAFEYETLEESTFETQEHREETIVIFEEQQQVLQVEEENKSIELSVEEQEEEITEQHIAAFEESATDFASKSVNTVEEEHDEVLEHKGLQPMTDLPGQTKRGRKSYKEIDATTDLIEVPDDETLNQKLYYSISEVATWFKLNTSQIRFWENEFDILKPRKNRKGDRLFRVEDIHNLKVIYYLLRNRKFSIEGAKEYLKNNKHKVDVNIQMVQSLTMFKSFLLELKANLGS